MGVRLITGKPFDVQYSRPKYHRHKDRSIRAVSTIPQESLRNRPEVIAEYRRMRYADYLQTEWWKKLKRAAIIRAGRKCEICSATDKPLQVHHLTYVRLGTEADTDLQALCCDCHENKHGLTPSKR